MKKIVFLLYTMMMIVGLGAFAQGDKKKPASPPMEAQAKVGEAMVTINYSSPGVKGRTIYGDLVPYGKIWRAGANNATTFESDKDLKLNGKDLPAGKYALFVIPMKDKAWTVIFNADPNQWGAYNHDASKDVLRIEAETAEIDATERLTYVIKDGKVHMDWATTRMHFTIE